MAHYLPRIIRWSEFESVSFYELLALSSCILKSMGKNLVLDEPLPESAPTKYSMIGIFYHRAMELQHECNSKQELEQAIEIEIDKMQEEVDRWPHLSNLGSVSGWDEINLSAVAVIRDFEINKSSAGGTKAVEKNVYSRDRRLVGRPDYFSIGGRRAFLKEFKSSSLKDDDGNVRVEYVKQLLFYAVLLFDNFDIDLVDASIVSSRGETYCKAINKADADAFKDEVLMLIDVANLRIKNAKKITDLESVSEESCNTCQKRFICDEYKRKQLALGITNSHVVIHGRLLNCTKISEQPMYTVSIQDTYLNELISVIIPERNVSEMEVGEEYVLAEISCKGSSFRWANQSRILHCRK